VHKKLLRDPDTEGDDDGPGVAEGEVLWEPSSERISRARVSDFLRWLATEHGLAFAGYDQLWQWSVDRLEEFWSCVWQYFDVQASGDPGRVLLRGNGAEGAEWFPDTHLNYVDQVLRHPPDAPALMAIDETDQPERLTYGQVSEMAGAAVAGLRRLGVGRGDRVAAVLPNGAPAVVAFLATASLGATWSSCAPEFGAPSMVDRFRQIEPKVLVMAAGYRYRGRYHDLSGKLADLERELPGLAATVVVPAVHGERSGEGQPGSGEGQPGSDEGRLRWAGEISHEGAASPRGEGDVPSKPSKRRIEWAELLSDPAPLLPERVPFSHPLWILYSSGTTGLPKPIVQGHGGILLEHLKALAFHCDLGPTERFFWFTTTGWMMWNLLVGGLLVGATVVCYDGDPNWPDSAWLWRMAEQAGITFFGTSAPYIETCRRAGLSPRRLGTLSVHTVGSTGAPLSPEGFAWAAREIADDVLVGSVSGGTDVCTAFLTSCPLLAVRAGELQCRALGAKVEAYDESGSPVVGEVGELVVTEPMPSMPTALWGDDGTRLHASYFDRFPGTWRHGDWVKMTSEGSAVVYGRSDATLNRGGVRMGTSEFYRVVESLPEVADALVVDTSELGKEGELLLFVVPAAPSSSDVTCEPGGAALDVQVENSIRQALRERVSPRHVPDRIVVVRALPRTINGKKLEVPVRRILLGVPPEEAVSSGALADPQALEGLIEVINTLGGE
jgi:acetoacetyl-CoA synthetase